MGRARRYVSDFMHEFMQGFIESHYNYAQERIRNNIAQTTADDYFDYQSNVNDGSTYTLRRNGEAFQQPQQQQPSINQNINIQPIQKVDPKLVALAEMIKNLRPKEKQPNNTNNFIIQYARAFSKSLEIGENSSNSKQFTHSANTTHDENVSPSELNTTSVGIQSEGRNFAPSTAPQVQQQIKRIFTQGPGPPPGLPSFNELPPADCNFTISKPFFNPISFTFLYFLITYLQIITIRTEHIITCMTYARIRDRQEEEHGFLII